jgi:hypothetical protein
MPKSVLHELRMVADTNNNLIEDVATGAYFTFNGRSHVYCPSVAAGTKKLPDAGIGTQATFKAAGSVTLTNSAGVTVATLSSTQLVTCTVTSRTSAGVSTWTAYAGNTSGISVSDASDRTTATTAEAWLTELANSYRKIEIPLQGAILAAGTPMAAFADNAAPNPGITLANSKATGIRWNNNATQNAPVWFNVPMPYQYFDASTTFQPTVYVLASKVGATVGDATTFTVTAFGQKVGQLHDADSNLIDDGVTSGVTSAMTGNAATKTVQQVSVQGSNLVGGTLPKVISLSITPTSGTLGTDDVIIHRLWMEF